VRKSKLIYLCLLVLITLGFTGCTSIDKMKVKLGLKNNDFEYIKQGKIEKIIIQNTRDKGFRFVVTDKKAIGELYDILSNAKVVSEKSTLTPDYVFEMQETPNKVYKFNYVAGLTSKESGNLYSEDKVYSVSKRIDSDIIKNFWNVRKPKDFEVIYYESILKALDIYAKDGDKSKKIGINLNDDIEAAKFILSADLENFKKELKKKNYNAELVEKDKEYDITMNVKTKGYKLTLYKGLVSFWNKAEMSEKKIWILDENIKSRWNFYISDKAPDAF